MSTPGTTPPSKELTHLEKQTISIVIHGKGRQFACNVLDINKTTLDQRMKFIYLKLPFNAIGELINWARDNGYNLKGNLNGVYLFEGDTRNFPWPPPAPNA